MRKLQRGGVESLTEQALQALKAENDAGLIAVNGEVIAVEMQDFTGTAGNDTINGTNNSDFIDGLAGNDSLNGSGGDDEIYGGAGNDTLNGGSGNDYLEPGTGDNLVIGGTGSDDFLNIDYTGETTPLTVEYSTSNTTIAGKTLFREIETVQIIGGAGNDVFNMSTTETSFDGLFGEGGNDYLAGGAGDDGGVGAIFYGLYGGAGNDTLDGGAGNDYLDPGTGDNLVIGGTGSDDFLNIDYTGETTPLTVEYSTSNTTIAGKTLFREIETVQIIGGAGNDVFNMSTTETSFDGLFGEGGNDYLAGGAGDDGGVGAIFYGLYGGAGNDTLDGGAGDDYLAGGTGSDTYVVDSIGDTVDESGGNGTDTVKSSIAYTLGSGLENLILTGTNNINGTGNGSNNSITGNSGNNSLNGLGGNDTLNGNAGIDTLVGGTGNDTYIVDTTTDTISENAAEGTDTIQSSLTFSLASLPNIENLTLIGTDNINATGNDSNNILTGNSGNNTLDGDAGVDTLVGGAGNDTYIIDTTTDTITENAAEGTDKVQSSVTFSLAALANVENVTLTGTDNINGTGNTSNNNLTGNSGNNTLTGDAGNDTLNGDAGIDTLVGGAGNDTYIVDTTTDTLTENAAEGTDTVQASVSYILGANLEKLTLTGTGNINATGNTSNNTLTGNSGNNTLTGDAGNDTLNGGGGIDTLVGGTGNDTYFVDTTTDTITENAAEGTDTVQSSVSYTLGANLEKLTLTGTGNINAGGNSGNNTLTGNSGQNRLNGSAGKDILTGGTNNDTFVFRFGQSTISNLDAITDFAIGSDKIDLLTSSGAATGSPTQFSRASDSAAATLTDVVNGVFADADGLTAGNQALAVNSAALVVVSTAGIAGTYLVINDPAAGFQSTVDSVVNISGYSGTLPSLGTIPVNDFFV